MAELRIGIGNDKLLIFHISTIRTQEYSTEPVMDQSGVHFECNKITLDIVGICNAVTIATNKPNQFKAERGNSGDSLPFSMFNMRDLLMHPRRSVTYRVGGQTVIDLPSLKAAGGRFECDARGGPFPQRASFTQISGDKSAVISYRVVCYDTYNNQVMLSNAWAMTSDIDRHGFTTRTVSGHATFSMDELIELDLEVDDFRRGLMVPTPDGMRRISVSVNVASNGFECDYTVVDREVQLGLGQGSATIEVTGSVTAGSHYPIKNLKGMIGVGLDIFGAISKADFFGGMKTAFSNAVPVFSVVGVARATGRKKASRAILSQTATAFIMDRFAPVVKDGCCFTTNQVTHNIDSDHQPYAEVRLEAFPFGGNAILGIFGIEPDSMLNLKNDFDSVVAKQEFPSPALPRSQNTRGGDSLFRMVAQALEDPTPLDSFRDANLPDDPPPNQQAENQAKI